LAEVWFSLIFIIDIVIYKNYNVDYMNKDFSELIECLDGKFAKIDAKLDEKSDKKDVQSLPSSIEKLTKSIVDYHEEYVALTAKVDRHKKWFF